MRLLPDINLNGGIVLSAQSPYTINDRLITKIDCQNYGRYYNYYSHYQQHRISYIELEIDNGQCFGIDYNELFDKYNRAYVHNRGIRFFDEKEREQYFCDLDNYIRSVERQCENLYRYEDDTITFGIVDTSNSGRANYCKYISTLKKQNRSECYNVTVDDNGNTIINLDNINARYVDIPSDRFRDIRYVTATSTVARDDIYNMNRRTFDFGSWIDFNNSSNNSNNSVSTDSIKTYIHPYNYKPEYIKHYMPDEDESTLLLGAEIEVAGNTKSLTKEDKEKTVKKCIQIMNGSDDDKEDLIYSTSDSSVQIELDTMPCTLDFHKQKMNYQELFKYLDEEGYKGHDCENAGLHVHANRSYLGKSELKQQLVITKILYILEKFNDEICVIARRNDYSKFVGKEEVNKTLDVLYKKYKDTGKKVALNLQHKDTIEFRCFKSTLKYETFLLTLEFVKDIIDYAKAVNIEDIELIKWSDLMDTFSDELKTYYNDRLAKEGKKKEVAKKKESEDSGSTRDAMQNLIDAFNRIGNVNVATPNELRRSLNGNNRSDSYDCDSAWSALYSHFCDVTNELISLNINNNDNSIDELKKEIRLLKKQIKNCNNYMSKKKLNQDLVEAQKKLKQLKKRQAS